MKFKGWTDQAPWDLRNVECINALVCERSFIFYDDRNRPLAPPAAGSVAPIRFYLGVDDNRRLGEGGGLVWGSVLINDWFVLVGLFHSSCKLDGMQILG